MAKLKVSSYCSTLLAVIMMYTFLLRPTVANFMFQDGFKIEMPVWFQLIPRLRSPILVPYRPVNTPPPNSLQYLSTTDVSRQFPLIHPGRPEFTPVDQTQVYPFQQTGRSEYPMFQHTSTGTQGYPVQSTVLPYRPAGYSVVNRYTPKPLLLPDQNVQYHDTSLAQPEVPPAPEEGGHQEEDTQEQENPEED